MTNNISFRKQSKSTEWYTPKKYIQSVKNVFDGKIELDPASCYNANKHFVQADRYYSIEDDGLSLSWKAKSVFLNPPYARGITKLWINKLIKEFVIGNVQNAVLLVNACPARSWFLPLFDFIICFTDHRIKFVDEFLIEQESPEYENAFILFTSSTDIQNKFDDEFKQHGNVVIRYW